MIKNARTQNMSLVTLEQNLDTINKANKTWDKVRTFVWEDASSEGYKNLQLIPNRKVCFGSMGRFMINSQNVTAPYSHNFLTTKDHKD
jgi:hypothetical protein